MSLNNFVALNTDTYQLPDTRLDVWSTPSSSTIADIAFAPISTVNIEHTNDYEPVAYQANRALRAAQAAQELNALQERNHSTTAYSTLNCVATPLFPTFSAQRAQNCNRQQANGVGSYGSPYGRERHALVRRASSGACPDSPNRAAAPIGYSKDYYTNGYYVRPAEGGRL